jgi:Zn-dependent protease
MSPMGALEQSFLDGLFLFMVKTDPVYFVSWIFTVVVSVVLHELGHGYAAIRQGDFTPEMTGHMTLDPLVHMGPFSLIALFVAGFAWGAMPVDPTRFKSKYGEAIVSFAGPAVNVLLAFLALTGLGLWLRLGGPPEGQVATNIVKFLWVFGVANLLLFLLNLLPIPPLDGSRVLGNFSRPFRRISEDPNNQGLFFVLFIGVFLGARFLVRGAVHIADAWLSVLAA